MSGRGVVYVVWDDPARRGAGWHVAAAERAAGYARRAGLATCLITDAGYAGGGFDRVVPAAPGWAGLEGFYRKWAALFLSPFEETLLTDTDLVITGDVSLAFAGARKSGVAATFAPGQVIGWRGEEFPHIQGGFLAFRGHRRTLLESILAAKLELGAGAYDDEGALSLALFRRDPAPFMLPSVFNVVAAGWVHPRPIRGWHSPLPPQSHLVSVLDNPHDAVGG